MSAASPSVFSRIVSGEIPAHKVYEDAHVLAFLDVGPLAPGHVLLIPKGEFATMDAVPEDVAAALGRVLPRLVRAVQSATGAPGINVLQNNGKVSGQEVMHVHFHLIPRQAGDGLGYRWNPGKYAPGEAEKLRDQLSLLLTDPA
ncbi:MAG TPA: HIT family protein [Phycisphaerae bacterium]|nr:HIT family protein [Phycisphaerales bacterium]HRX86774.1 HIT family protein [Phycisphaerae bacterium]